MIFEKTPCAHEWRQTVWPGQMLCLKCCEITEPHVPTLTDAAEAVLLFHSAGPWTEAKRQRWQQLTGAEVATMAILCETCRAALKSGLAAPDLLALVLDAPLTSEHSADERGPCLCSHCEWVRRRRAVLTKAEGSRP